LHYAPCITISKYILRDPSVLTTASMSVDYIDQYTIENTNTIDTVQAISRATGLNVVQSGPTGQQTSVFMRGMNSNHTMVAINGVAIKDHSTTGGLHDIGSDFIKHVTGIQVVKGSQGTLYGANAVGGVINFITTDSYANSISLTTGSNNTKGLTLKIHKNINKVLLLTKNSTEKNLIHTLFIRSMSKAKYSEKNIGHFGLNFQKYTHFTSPIRRYPDVIVHRKLQEILSNKVLQNPNTENKCIHLSKREELATKAERSSIKFMQVKYMSSKINKIYKGTISGVIERGLFVEINENKCEGFIKLKDVPGDYFLFDNINLLVYGRHTKKEHQLGDVVSVKVMSTDIINKRIELKLLENN